MATLNLPVLKDQFVITERKDTRSGFGDGMLDLASSHENVLALCADLTGSLKLTDFAKKYPKRFIQCGIAEANMMGVAAGLATGGFIPFATTFANFATGRVYDQIRQSICYSGKNVKIAASHAGLTLGEDGATHQILEDIGMMRMLPGMTVIVPADYRQTRAATVALADHVGPAYLRFGRPVMPVFYPEDKPFVIGKADVLQEGTDVTLIACGHLVWEGVEAASQLASEGISVELINMHTIKPLDEEAILRSVAKTGCVVTAEEHQRAGGLADAVSQVLTRKHLAPLEAVAVEDTFGESGTPAQLMTKYGLTSRDIIERIRRVMGRKQA